MVRTDADRRDYRNWYNRNREKILAKKREQMKESRKRNPQKHRDIAKKARVKRRQALFDIYGRKCASCGFKDLRALTLDHVLNNGAAERKRLGEIGVYIRALMARNRKDYQILCMNCQFIKRSQA